MGGEILGKESIAYIQYMIYLSVYIFNSALYFREKGILLTDFQLKIAIVRIKSTLDILSGIKR